MMTNTSGIAAAPSSSTPENPVSFVGELSEKEQSGLQLELESFVVRHSSHRRPIAVVTSGGTVADLEVNSVRCLDNFSTGLRGSISVEEFLRRGYAVIHLWREGSSSPYGRALSESIGLKQANYGLTIASLGKLFSGDPEEEKEDQLVQAVLDEQQDPWMTEPETQTDSAIGTTDKKPNNRSKPESGLTLHRRICDSSKIRSALKERSAILKQKRLLTVPFRSVEEYLAKLQLIAESVQICQALAILYLAAAVSDFYIPKSQRVEHKIQSRSTSGGLTLNLVQVPKLLSQVRAQWAPDAFLCTFKLETDPTILRQKSEQAVHRYGSNLVIGNLLHTRHEEVLVLVPDSKVTSPNDVPEEWQLHRITKPPAAQTDALESLIIDFVVQEHFSYISSSFNSSFDKSGTKALLLAHQELERKKQQIERDVFWKQVKGAALEWGGTAVGCIASYIIASALRRRMNR